MGALFHPLSVKSKAALVTTAGVLLLFAAFTVFELRHIRTEMQAVLGAQQFTLISSIAGELDDKIRSTHRALIVTAEATPPEMLADLAAMERSLRRQPGYRSFFDDVFLIRRNGLVLIDLPVLERRGIDVHDRDYFRRTLDTRKPVISEPYIGRGPVKEPAVMMTAPILDRSGEVVGILSGNIHPLKVNLLGKLREARVGVTGRFILFSRDRTIIVSREPDRIMTKGPEPGVTPYLDNAMAGREGWEESVNSRGERALYSYKQLASVPWVLVAALPVEEAYAPITAAQARAVGITGLLALLLTPLVWFGMQYVLSPIGVLRDTIRRIHRDPESNALVQMSRQDELGDLADDFNAMTRERRRANQALRASEARLAKMIQASPAATTITHFEDGTFVEVNQAALDVFGRTREEMIGQTALGLGLWPNPGDRAEFVKALRASGTLKLRPVTVRRKSGELRNLLLSAAQIEVDNQKQMLMSAVDITDIRHAESLRQQSEERFAKIFQASPDAIVISRLEDGRYLEVNQRWLELFGYTREELIGRSSLDLGVWVDPADRTRFVEQIGERGGLRDFEARFRKKSGAVIDALVSAEPMEIDGEPHIIVPLQDVTDRKRAEQAMREHQALLRELSVHLESVREEERAHIAREIHDELGQALTALKMDLAMLGMKFGAGNPAIKERVQELKAGLDNTIQVVRDVATALRPAALDFGIFAAVEGLVEEFQKRSGIHCTVKLLGAETHLAEDRSIVIFRILQESLTNISRHAGAKNVEVTVRLDTTHCHLDVKDDGSGFDINATEKRKTFGLLGIRERAIMLNGEVRIRSSPGAGTEVSLSIPHA